MGGTIVCIVATVLLGVDARWPALPDGGRQYVVQIEPEVLDQLESGAIESLESHVPPYVHDIRAYQIVIGTRELTWIAARPYIQSQAPTGVQTDWVPLPDGRFECRMWIQPDAIEELQQSGSVIEDWIPANVKTLSRFTIAVGTKPVAEEPIVEEPIVEESVVEESAAEEPLTLPHNPQDVPRNVGNAQPASYYEPLDNEPDGPAPNPTPPAVAASEWPFSPSVTLLGLAASLAANIFLLWLVRDFRKHHRALLKRMGEVGDIARG